MLTPRQAIDYLVMRLGAQSISGKPCLSQRAFYIIRRTLVKHFSVCRSEVRPESYLCNLLPDNGRRNVWKLFIDKLGFGKVSGILGLPILGAGSTTVNDLMTELVTNNASLLISNEERWSRHQIRDVVRNSVKHVVGVSDFSDDDKFVQDIGID